MATIEMQSTAELAESRRKMQAKRRMKNRIALALLQVPIVIRTTENMLKLVPDSLREAAYALGTPKWKMISAITPAQPEKCCICATTMV